MKSSAWAPHNGKCHILSPKLSFKNEGLLDCSLTVTNIVSMQVQTLGSLCPVQSCYGHTEGAAGLTGAFLAVEALAKNEAPGIMSLREVNPYVAAALADWRRRSGRSPLLPRASTPHGLPTLAGKRSLCFALRGQPLSIACSS